MNRHTYGQIASGRERAINRRRKLFRNVFYPLRSQNYLTDFFEERPNALSKFKSHPPATLRVSNQLEAFASNRAGIYEELDRYEESKWIDMCSQCQQPLAVSCDICVVNPVDDDMMLYLDNIGD